MDGHDLVGGFGEGGRTAARAAAGIAALRDGLGVLQRPLAGQGEDGVSAEAEAGGSAADADALRPVLGGAVAGAGPDEETQAEAAASVAVPAGDVDGLDEGGGQHGGAFERFRGGFHYSFQYVEESRWSVPGWHAKRLELYVYQLLKEPWERSRNPLNP